MTAKKNEEQKDQMADVSQYDHENSVLLEPSKDKDPEVRRHQVDPIRDPKIVKDEGNGPVPRRGDPYAHQRDEKVAKAEHKKESAKKDDKAEK